MADRRIQSDAIASGLFGLGFVLALSLLTYEPAAEVAVFPQGGQAQDLLGEPGVWIARFLFETLGLGVYPFLAAWFVLVLMLFIRRQYFRWAYRLTGWVLLVPLSAFLADGVNLPFRIPAVASAGGTVGAWLHASLAAELPANSLWILAVCSAVVAFFLAFDWLWARSWRISSRSLVWALRVAWRALRPVQHGKVLDKVHHFPFPRKKPALPAADAPANLELQPADTSGPVSANIPIRHHDAANKAIAEARQLQAEQEDGYSNYELPPIDLLADPQPFPYEVHDHRLRERAALLEKTFTDFGLNVRVVGINTGPVITQYEVALETGLRLAKVTGLSDDVALNLKVPSVRVVAPIPGKNTVGIEIPNEHRAVVRLKEVVLAAGSRVAKTKIPLFLGKDTEGRPLVYDLAEMPHLLIAGRTGTGKSVCMNAIVLSILMTRRPDEVRMIMIDPKMLELSEYGRIPHLMHPVVKDMKKAEAILSWAVDKMEERYDLLSRARVRGIAGYNELGLEEILRRVQPADDDEAERITERMPYIVIFVDEMNDLMMTMKKEVEGHIIRLAQKSRAAGIHLVVATQKPTVDVITGLIKSNLPARICFQVSSRSDSRVVLDEMGADKLLGKGDMLFLQPGTSILLRAQGTYASDEEITRVVQHLECDPCYSQELIQLQTANKESGNSYLDSLRARDELYEQAIEVIVREGRGSVSLLQRTLGVGYGRAARLIDFMAEDGIVGGYNGSQAREVLYTPEQWDQVKHAGTEA